MAKLFQATSDGFSRSLDILFLLQGPIHIASVTPGLVKGLTFELAEVDKVRAKIFKVFSLALATRCVKSMMSRAGVPGAGVVDGGVTAEEEAAP